MVPHIPQMVLLLKKGDIKRDPKQEGGCSKSQTDRDLVCMLRYFCKVDNYFQCSDEKYDHNYSTYAHHFQQNYRCLCVWGTYLSIFIFRSIRCLIPVAKVEHESNFSRTFRDKDFTNKYTTIPPKK